MKLQTLLDKVQNIPQLAEDDPKKVMPEAFALHDEMEKQGLPAVNAVSMLLQHEDPDIVAAATFVLGTEWSIANYTKIMDVMRMHKDHLPLHSILISGVFGAYHVTKAPIFDTFFEEYKTWGEDHADALAMWSYDFEQKVNFYREERRRAEEGDEGMVQ